MTIETTLGACVDAEPALSRIATQRFSATTAYRLATLLRLLRVEVQQFDAQRVALVKEFGTSRPPTAAEVAAGASGDEVVQVPPAHVPAFNARWRELRDVPVTVAAGPITLADLDGREVTPMDLFELGAFFVGDTTPS